MNFLEICKDIRLLSGAQGTGPTSVVDVDGYEQALVAFAKDAYVDIQNIREDFRFLRSTHSGFTVIDQSDYTHAVKSFRKNTVKILVDNKWVYLPNVDYDSAEITYVNATSGKPTFYAEVQHNIIRLYPTPDKIYTTEAEVMRNPEILTTDAQIPLLPIAFHKLIVYEGLKKFSVFLGNPEIYREYATEAARMKQELMSLEVPQKVMRHVGSFAI